MKKYNFKEVDKIEKISGVYQIVNELNGHRYIGSSKNIQHRILVHRSALRRNSHHSIYLQNAFNKGDHSNIHPYENNSLNVIQQFKRPVLQLDDNYNIINEFESISDASRYLNKPYAISNIARCAKGFVKHAVGYIWRYKDKLNNNIHDYEQQP